MTNSQQTNHVLTVSDHNFEKAVLQSELPVLVDFWAEWCGPCKVVGPTMDALADAYAGHVKVAKVDVDANLTPPLYGVRSIPTVMLFVDGEVKTAWIGAQPMRRYEDGINQILR